MSIEALVKGKSSKLFTLIIVEEGDKTLLGFKKRGFGINKWNGFGGKVEPGEEIIDAAKRELWEECGLIAKSLQRLGVLYFENTSWKDVSLYEVHLFKTTEYEGKITESEEMIPKWFLKEELPFDDMWPSTKYWLPKAIDGDIFDAFFLYENEENLVNIKIQSNGTLIET